LLFKQDYRFYLQSSSFMDSVRFKPCDWSQFSRRCPWRFLAISKSDQPVPVQPSGWAFEGFPDALQCLEASVLNTSEQHRPDTRSSYPKFYTELAFSRHCLGSFCKTSRQCGNTSRHYPAFQNILGFLYRRGKELQWRTSGRLANPTRRGPIMGRIALFWKGSCRRPFGRG